MIEYLRNTLHSIFQNRAERNFRVPSSFPQRNLYSHVDLGCFTRPRGADIGIDVKVPPTFPEITKFIQCNLGFERIPLENDSCDFVTAFDVLEHVPKILWFTESSINGVEADIFKSDSTEISGGIVVIKPAIFLMNEISRVLKPGGQFLSHTPALGRILDLKSINSFMPIHQDPTHVNVWTYKSFTEYFCPPIPYKSELFQQQLSNGIRTAFKNLPWGSFGKYPVEGTFFRVGHDDGYLTMILEKLENSPFP